MAENKARHLPADSALAQLRGVRMTPQKVRRVVDLVRDRAAADAVAMLAFAPQAASEPVRKLIQSAVANAEHNRQLDRESLWITQAYVDEGPTVKRFRPRAQGRPGQILKRSSHITVVVSARPDQTRPAARRGTGRGAGAAAPGRGRRSAPARQTQDEGTR